MDQNEKQAIEEMAEVLEKAKIDAHTTIGSMNNGFGMWYATAVYNAGYRKQSEGEWKDNHCTICGMTPIGEETWTKHNITPPRFEWFMDFCPNCGAHMKGGDKDD